MTSIITTSICAPNSGAPNQQTDELKFMQRKNALKRFKVLSIIMMVGSISSIITGIAIVAVLKDGGGFPLVTGSPIWSGLLVLVAASFGLGLSCTKPEWKNDTDRSLQRCLLVAFYIISVVSCSMCGISVIYTIMGAIFCGEKHFNTCGSHWKAETYLNILGVACAVLLLVSSVTVAAMFCYYRKGFIIDSTNDRIDQMQRLLIQQQQHIASLSQGRFSSQTPFNQQTEDGYGTNNFQSGFGATSNGHSYGTNFSSAPPPYAEKENV